MRRLGIIQSAVHAIEALSHDNDTEYSPSAYQWASLIQCLIELEKEGMRLDAETLETLAIGDEELRLALYSHYPSYYVFEDVLDSIWGG